MQMRHAPTLNTLRPGRRGVVKAILLTGALKHRLIDMGITPGVVILVKKTAPLGDPMELQLRGYTLTIRAADAKKIVISPVEEGHL